MFNPAIFFITSLIANTPRIKSDIPRLNFNWILFIFLSFICAVNARLFKVGYEKYFE